MNQLLFYVIQVGAASGLLYGYYHFALRNKRFHRYNRFYLLAAVVISIYIPFLNIPVYFTADEAASSAVLQTLQVISSPAVDGPMIQTVTDENRSSSTWFTVENLVYLFYILILSFFFLRVLVSLFKIRTIIKSNTAEKFDKIEFINTNEPGTPFSFFHWLFWNRKIELNSEKGEQIFRHEFFHIQQKHSWDIIFMELITTIFWINPFFHLMKKELKALHEFLADEFAITENRNWQYAELLLMQVLNTNNQLVNPFFHNQIKRRIAMITSSSKPSYRYLRKLMVLPVAAIVIFLFAFNYKDGQNNEAHKIDKAKNAITVVIDAGHGGSDPGAKTRDKKYTEAQLTLEIAKKIRSLAHEYNINVFLTREDDNFSGGATTNPEALSKTIDLVNTVKPNAFVAIHMNTTSVPEQSLRSGIGGYISSKRDSRSDVEFATAILNELKKVYTTSLEIKKRHDKGIFVLDKSGYPSFLVECGYINNPSDLSFIIDKTNQEKVARAILKGLATFANNSTSRHSFDGSLRAYVNGSVNSESLPINDLKNALIVIDNKVQALRGIAGIDSNLIYQNKIEIVNVFVGKRATDKYGEIGRDGVIEMETKKVSADINNSLDTIPKVDTIYWVKDLPSPAKKSPTQEQLNKWTDGKMYGVWLDGKRISNTVLSKYKASDFGFYNVSKLAKNTVNYGKHYYQINLYTNKYYDETYGSPKYNRPMLVREVILDSAIKLSSPLMVINEKQMPGLTLKELNALIPVDSVISITTLNKEEAIKKYGAKAENGAIEVKTRTWGPVVSPIMKTDKGQPKNPIDGKAILDHDNKVFVKVEIEPSFPGGQVGWSEFIKSNISAKIPVDSGAQAGTYTVFLQFIVDRSGNISNMRPLTNHGFGMEQECIRVMKLSPNWIPARQNGHIVAAYKKQPFTFVIAEDEGDDEAGKNNLKESVASDLKKPFDKKEIDQLPILYPNPTNNQITILTTSAVAEKGVIRIYDLSGSLKMTNHVNIIKGKNTFVLKLPLLSAGTYVVNVVSADKNLRNAFKFIKN